MTQPLFIAFGHGFSMRDLILIAGGLFLIWIATKEIHDTVDPQDRKDEMVSNAVNVSLGGAIFQILLLDRVFSVDSIIINDRKPSKTRAVRGFEARLPTA